jgi:glycosyltransferase involved in cell wall biosynthesis
MTTPKVSIGMPVYNGNPFIREALDSLLSQTFTDFELIISDNASTDATEAICREYASKDARIRYVRQPENRGASLNFKFVLDEAVGEYFMWAAADDVWSTQFVELTSAVLDSQSEVGLVFSDGKTFSSLENWVTHWHCSQIVSKRLWLKYIVRLQDGNPSLIYGLHRRSTLNRIPILNFDYFDLSVGYWYELNSKIKIIPLYLYSARVGKHNSVPRSLTGDFISYREYILFTYNLLRCHFSLPVAWLLIIITWGLIVKATLRHNRVIRQHNKHFRKQ